VNSVGNSTASNPSAAVVPANFPQPPTILSVTVGPSVVGNVGQATISWEASGDNGGSPILNYEAKAFNSSDSLSAYIICTSTTSNPNQCTITGLNGGSSYFFRVRAMNAQGASDYSMSSETVAIPVSIPGAPTATTWWNFDSGNVGLRLTMSNFSGGNTIKVKEMPGGLPCENLTYIGSFQYTCTINKISTSDNFRVEVTTSNSAGEGAPLSLYPPTKHLIWNARIDGMSMPILYSVTWTGTKLVAVGDAGTILVSSNGDVWDSITSGTGSTLRNVIWHQGELVSVGAAGTILTSADGNTWTTQSSGTTTQLFSVAGSNALRVAVGDSGKIFISLNGLTWSEAASPTTKRLNSVVWTGTRFLASGDQKTLLSSEDGSNWVIRNSQVTSGTFLDLNAVGPRILAVGWEDYFWGRGGHGKRPVIWESPDGLSWTPQAPTGANLSSVTWTGKEYFAVGNNHGLNFANALVSKEGLSWEMVSVSHMTPNFYPSFNSVVWTGSRLVAVGHREGVGVIFSSP
jgi:hypothetical protein